jgi:hypothetical protein
MPTDVVGFSIPNVVPIGLRPIGACPHATSLRDLSAPTPRIRSLGSAKMGPFAEPIPVKTRETGEMKGSPEWVDGPVVVVDW